MASSEEYLANLGFDVSDMEGSADRAITILGALGNQFDGLTKYTDRAERALESAGSAGKNAAEGARQSGQGAVQGSKEWQKLTTELEDARRAFKLFEQDQAAGTTTPGAKGLDSYSKAQIAQFQETAAAQKSSLDKRISDQQRAADSGLRIEQRAAQEQVNALRRVEQARERALGQLPRLRYALFDVANTSAVFGAATLASGVAVEATAIKFERAFADVRRTGDLGASVEETRRLKDSLLDISSEIPLDFPGVTQIATLGNQLGIPAADLANFSEVVAKFAATTNVSTEEAATAFGRLGELLGTNDYRKLGDDIAYLGVNAVATESQIIKTAKEIAVSANAAGFAEGETLALATALASLGIAPEQARGSILRTFGVITAAVNSGGAALNELGVISGKSSADFATQWRGDPQKAFTELLAGIQKSGSGINATLGSLGITATRDIQTLGVLSQNVDVLTQAQSDLANSNGYLDKSYGVVAETVSSKLQILANNVQRIFDTIGSQANGPISTILDLLNRLSLALNDILANPFAAGGAAFSLTFITIAGAALILFAGLNRVAGSYLALQTAATEAGVSTNFFTLSVDVLRGKLGAAAIEANALAASERALAGSSTAAATAQVGHNASLDGATTKGSKLTSVLGKAGLVGSLLALIPLFPALIEGTDSWIKSLTGAELSADALKQKITDLGTEATRVAAEGALDKVLGGEMSVTSQKTGKERTVTGLGLVSNAQSGQPNVNGQSKSQFLDQSGADALAVRDLFEQTKKGVEELDAALAALASSGNTQAAKDGLDAFMEKARAAGLSTEEASRLLPQYTQAIGATEGANLSAAAAAQEAAASADAQREAFDSIISSAYDAANADFALQESLFSLGSAFEENGAAAAVNGQEMQKVLQGIYESSGSASEAASRMQGLFNALVQGGYASAQQLSILQGVISSLAGGKVVKAATFDMSNFAGGIQKVQQAATGSKSGRGGSGGAAKAVRTLADYASDLQKVFSRSFEIRFGGDQGSDKINAQWNDMRQVIDDANESIATSIEKTRLAVQDYQATMSELNADKSINQYWLSIAEKYNDTLRAGELRAAIAKNDSDLAKSAADLAEAQKQGAAEVQTAQDKTNKTLEGNSAVAIANRAQILALVGDYQGYIAQLASSGMSQAELQAKSKQLKQEFIQQATQLGFNQNELGKYANAFDDVSVAISRVPRNITVTANVNPALQALNEIEAKARNLSNQSYSGPSVQPSASALKEGRRLELMNRISELQSLPQTKQTFDLIAYNLQKLNSGQFRSGGYTGNIPTNKVAGQVHGREYVLNARATASLDRSQLDAMNQGRMPYQPVPVPMAGSGSGSRVVELSPIDRRLLAAAGNIGLSIGNQPIANAANSANDVSARRGSN